MPEGISALPPTLIRFAPHLVSVGQIEVDLVSYQYALLNRAAGRYQFFSGFDRSSEWLYLSIEVPAEYVVPMLKHEIYEHRYFQREEMPCLAALQRELAELGSIDRLAYLRWRKEALIELSRYVNNRANHELFPPWRRQDVSAAYTHLVSILEVSQS